VGAVLYTALIILWYVWHGTDIPPGISGLIETLIYVCVGGYAATSAYESVRLSSVKKRGGSAMSDHIGEANGMVPMTREDIEEIKQGLLRVEQTGGARRYMFRVSAVKSLVAEHARLTYELEACRRRESEGGIQK
jgi:hypothetical protein